MRFDEYFRIGYVIWEQNFFRQKVLYYNNTIFRPSALPVW